MLVSTVPNFLASYDLPLTDKTLQNRDRTVIEAGALRDAVRAVLAASEDQAVIDRFATHVLAGDPLREPEQFFTQVTHPRVKAAWRAWARANLPEKTFYTSSGQRGGRPRPRRHRLHRGRRPRPVPAGPVDGHGPARRRRRPGQRQQRHYAKTQDKTTWVADRALTAGQRTALRDACTLVRAAIGAFALDRVRVYAQTQTNACAFGFYNSLNGVVAIHQDTLTDRHQLLGTLLHEAAHRVAHRGGGRWVPVPDYGDRCRGFEDILTEFAGLLLGHLADGAALATQVDPLDPAPDHTGRRTRADDPAVPISRRELAHLLTDRLPHALTAGGFATVNDLVASTAVHPEYWRTLTHPRPAGYRRTQGAGGRAWDYDKVGLLAEAVGVHPPVAWLGYNVCEGPLHGRRREQWGQPGPWAKRILELTLRACDELTELGGGYAAAELGGGYAAQVPALHALVDGQTPAPTGQDGWQAPVRALIALERQRLGLTAPPS